MVISADKQQAGVREAEVNSLITEMMQIGVANPKKADGVVRMVKYLTPQDRIVGSNRAVILRVNERRIDAVKQRKKDCAVLMVKFMRF